MILEEELIINIGWQITVGLLQNSFLLIFYIGQKLTDELPTARHGFSYKIIYLGSRTQN